VRSVVHLELHTGDPETASSFYAELLGWEVERIDTPARDRRG
jgi:predicted enzyme related to lactoylglutathione lyase